MRIRPDLKAREIAGETIVLLSARTKSSPTKIISFNSTAKFLWENLQGKDFTCEDAVALLLDNYEVSSQTATEDVTKWIAQLQENGVLAG